jgi:hypothetical protein
MSSSNKGRAAREEENRRLAGVGRHKSGTPTYEDSASDGVHSDSIADMDAAPHGGRKAKKKSAKRNRSATPDDDGGAASTLPLSDAADPIDGDQLMDMNEADATQEGPQARRGGRPPRAGGKSKKSSAKHAADAENEGEEESGAVKLHGRKSNKKKRRGHGDDSEGEGGDGYTGFPSTTNDEYAGHASSTHDVLSAHAVASSYHLAGTELAAGTSNDDGYVNAEDDVAGANAANDLDVDVDAGAGADHEDAGNCPNAETSDEAAEAEAAAKAYVESLTPAQLVQHYAEQANMERALKREQSMKTSKLTKSARAFQQELAKFMERNNIDCIRVEETLTLDDAGNIQVVSSNMDTGDDARRDGMDGVDEAAMVARARCPDVAPTAAAGGAAGGRGGKRGGGVATRGRGGTRGGKRGGKAAIGDKSAEGDAVAESGDGIDDGASVATSGSTSSKAVFLRLFMEQGSGATLTAGLVTRVLAQLTPDAFMQKAHAVLQEREELCTAWRAAREKELRKKLAAENRALAALMKKAAPAAARGARGGKAGRGGGVGRTRVTPENGFETLQAMRKQAGPTAAGGGDGTNDTAKGSVVGGDGAVGDHASSPAPPQASPMAGAIADGVDDGDTGGGRRLELALPSESAASIASIQSELDALPFALPPKPEVKYAGRTKAPQRPALPELAKPLTAQQVFAEVLYRCIKSLHRPVHSVLKIQPTAGRPKHGIFDLSKMAPSVKHNVVQMQQLKAQAEEEAAKFTTQRASCKLWLQKSKPLLKKYFQEANIKEDRIDIDEVVDVVTETPDPDGGDNVTVTTSTMTAKRTVRVYEEERPVPGELTLWDMSTIIDDAVSKACPITEPFTDAHVPYLLTDDVIRPLLTTMLEQVQAKQRAKETVVSDIYAHCNPVKLPDGSNGSVVNDIANMADVDDYDDDNNADGTNRDGGDGDGLDDATAAWYRQQHDHAVKYAGMSTLAAETNNGGAGRADRGVVYPHTGDAASDSDGFYDASAFGNDVAALATFPR